MINETKLALRISNNAYNGEILDLIGAGIADLGIVGATINVTTQTSAGVVTDYVVSDPLIKRALITYVRLNFGSPDDYDRLKMSYDEQKAQLRMNPNYMED